MEPTKEIQVRPDVCEDEVFFIAKEIIDAGLDHMLSGPGSRNHDEYASLYPQITISIAASILYRAVQEAERKAGGS